MPTSTDPTDEPTFPGIRQFDHTDFSQLRRSKDRQQHNIMMLVGNGFDLAVLEELDARYRTDYQSFFYYLKSLNFDSENTIFKKMDELRQAHETALNNSEEGFPNWSDFEHRLLEIVESEDPSKYSKIRTDLAEIRQHFARFLDLVVSPDILNGLDEKASEFQWAYSTFSRFLADLDRDSFNRIQLPAKSDHYDLFNFNIINFNYTSLLDNYLYLDQEQFNPHPHKGADRNFEFRRNPRNHTPPSNWPEQLLFPNAETGCSSYLMTEIYHPHGRQSIPRSLLFGIDGNDEVAERGSQHKLEKTYWAQSPRRYLKMIRESELFIVFGSSLGETDRWWWRHILSCIDANAESSLVIYRYAGSGQRVDSEEFAKAFVLENFDPRLHDGDVEDTGHLQRLVERVRIVQYSESETLSAFGFSKTPYDPKNRNSSNIPELK